MQMLQSKKVMEKVGSVYANGSRDLICKISRGKKKIKVNFWTNVKK